MTLDPVPLSLAVALVTFTGGDAVRALVKRRRDIAFGSPAISSYFRSGTKAGPKRIG
jgi:hypothetical protein